MREFFQLLQSRGFISRQRVDEAKIARTSPTKLVDLAHELTHMTPARDEKESPGTFSHCASISLGGGRDECHSMDCRLRRLEKLARYAALYSDRVYIRNFFSDYLHYTTNYQDYDESGLKRDFTDDIRLSLYLRPLLERGIVRFVSETGQICFDCLGNAMGLGQKSGGKVRKARTQLAREFFGNTTFVLIKDGDQYLIELSGPEYYYHNGGRTVGLRGLPEPIRSRPRILQKVEKEGKLKLSTTLSHELKLHEDLADQVFHELTYQLLINSTLGTSFLTDKELHLAFLRHGSDDRTVEERNAIAYRHLTTLVPFLPDVSVKDLLKVRIREADGFVQFRARMNQCIAELKDQRSGFTEKTARAMYSDLIAPELARLEKRVRNAKKDLRSSITRSLLGTVGAISFGLLAGAIPTEVAQIAQAVGVVGFGSQMIQKIVAAGDAKKTIRNEDLYFLWQVKKAAKRS